MSMPLDVSAVCAMLRFTTPRFPLTVTAVKITLPTESRSNSQTRWFQVLAAGTAQDTAEATHFAPVGSQTRHAFWPFRSHWVETLAYVELNGLRHGGIVDIKEEIVDKMSGAVLCAQKFEPQRAAKRLRAVEQLKSRGR